jgi:hypothetical protein
MAFNERCLKKYCFDNWLNFWRRGRLLSDFQEMKRNSTAQNIKEYEKSCKRLHGLITPRTWQHLQQPQYLREAAAAEHAADIIDAYIADEVPTPEQMFSDTDDGY